MSIVDHLLAHRVLVFDEHFPNETAFKLYEDMTENAVFASSLVSDKKGELNATEDTQHVHVPHQGRVSETAFFNTFTKRSVDLLNSIRDEVCEWLNVNADQFEPWQCTRYFSGGKFDYHDDCGNWASNERLYTVMYTVRGADVGGETHFDVLNFKIASKSNRLLLWRNLNEDYLCDGVSRHSGCPVGFPDDAVTDEKMIVVTWIRRFKYQ